MTRLYIDALLLLGACLLATAQVHAAVCQPDSLTRQQQRQACGLAASHTCTVPSLHNSSSGAAPRSSRTVPGKAVPEAQTLIDWILANGGEVSVAVRSVPGAGRAVFAARDFAPGDVFARIPVELAYRVNDDGSQLPLSAIFLLADMLERDSPWTPFFRSWPKPAELQSFPQVPRSYLPLIQEPGTEGAIAGLQGALDQLWDHYERGFKAVHGPGASRGNVSYAASVLLTRLHQFSRGTGMVVPLLDMGNHHAGCPHTHVPEPCDAAEGERRLQQGLGLQPLADSAGTGEYGSSSGTSGQCIVWRAQARVAAGSEVCISYKTLFQDRALLQYGFTQSGRAARELSGMDRHDYNPEQPWADPPGSAQPLGARRFEGTPAQLDAEARRLSSRLAALAAADAAAAAATAAAAPTTPTSTAAAVLVAAATTPATTAADPDLDLQGHFLSSLLQWRQQRQAALAAEVARLRRQQARLERAAAAAAAAAGSSRLTAWLERNGAQVAVEPKHAPASSRGVVAREHLSRGDVMAIVPLSLGYVINPGVRQLDSAVDLMLDIAAASNASSSSGGLTLAPLLQSLPPFGSVSSPYTLPAAYLPHLANQQAAQHISRLQAALATTWEQQRGRIEAADTSLAFAELQHAMSLVVSRPLLPVPAPQGDEALPEEQQQVLLPLFADARHAASCPHDFFIDACSDTDGSGSSGWCLHWIAGSELQAGDEVCTSFGALRPDQALLLYGQPLPAALDEQLAQYEAGGGDAADSSNEGLALLCGMDTADATPDQPFGGIADELEPWTEAGSREEAVAEAARLVNLHTSIVAHTQQPSAAAAADQPQTAWDASGALLAQLQLLRCARLAAIELQLQHLTERWGIDEPELEAAADAALALGGQEDEETAAGVTDSDGSPWQRLLDWLRQYGGQSNVGVVDAGPERGRIVIARQALEAGELLAAIPLDMTWSTVHQGGNQSLELAAANLAADMSEADSPWGPYFQALPSPAELLVPLLQLPGGYSHLLQSDLLEHTVWSAQQLVDAFWAGHGAAVQARMPQLTEAAYQHARGLLATRLFGLGAERGASLVPLLDMANHAPGCPHTYAEAACPADQGRACVLWRAGAPVAAGAEVCNDYKAMANDRAMLQYGFLQEGPVAQQLHTMDAAGFDEASLLGAAQEQQQQQPAALPAGSELKELQRLRGILAEVAAGEEEAAATQPLRCDADGRLLRLLLAWRQQRKAALEVEVGRLAIAVAAAAA